MSKTVWVIIIIILIGLGVWYAYSPMSGTSNNTSSVQTQTTGGMSSPADVSDSALDQDAGAVDSQLKNLSADSASLDESLGSTTQSAPVL